MLCGLCLRLSIPRELANLLSQSSTRPPDPGNANYWSLPSLGNALLAHCLADHVSPWEWRLCCPPPLPPHGLSVTAGSVAPSTLLKARRSSTPVSSIIVSTVTLREACRALFSKDGNTLQSQTQNCIRSTYEYLAVFLELGMGDSLTQGHHRRS